VSKRMGGELASRPLHFIWIADSSGSMEQDGKIQALNTAIREAIPHMRKVAEDNPLALCGASDGNVTVGDLGYRGQPAAQLLAQEAELVLITRRDTPTQKFLLSQVRQAIETSFSQLWHQFIDRVFSRSWNGLWNTIKLKVLFYNVRHAGVLSV